MMQLKALSSDFLRKRGSCCKSNCLHCPFGTTLRNIGVKIIPLNDSNKSLIETLISSFAPSDSISHSLLSSAFGKQPSFDIKFSNLLTLKEIPCGIAYIENNKLIKHYLLEEFSDQGITKAYLEGLL